jgi:uncharacterized membrane protein (UPF0127 family)
MKYDWPARIGNKSLMLVPLMTDKERTKGYQHAENSPSEFEGALFVFEDELPRTFHMKNVPFDLDLLGFNAEWRLVFALPMAANGPCHYETLPCKYAVEVPKGWSSDLAIGASKLNLLNDAF